MKNENILDVLILGQGFIGKSFENFYKKNGLSVVTIRLRDDDFFKKIASINNHKIDKLLVPASITRLIDNSNDAFNMNIKIVNVINALCKNNTIINLVYFSTIDVYGQSLTKQAINELTDINPSDFYSKAKFESEQIIQKTLCNSETKLFILRLVGVFGELDNGNSTISKMVSDAVLNKELTITVSPMVYRDYIYIDDLINVVDLLTEGNETGILNIATGTSYSLIEVSSMIAAYFYGIRIIKHIQENNNRSSELFFDISKLRTFIEYDFIPLNESINQLIISKYK